MKKFYLILALLLSFGSVSFANNIADKNFDDVLELVDSPTACCKVGEFTECGESSEPLCARARKAYCAKHQCTKETIDANDKLLN